MYDLEDASSNNVTASTLLLLQLSNAFKHHLLKFFNQSAPPCSFALIHSHHYAGLHSMPGQTSTVKKAARGPHRLAKTPTADDGLRPGTAPRTVRPRQLHVNDKVSIQQARQCMLLL